MHDSTPTARAAFALPVLALAVVALIGCAEGEPSLVEGGDLDPSADVTLPPIDAPDRSMPPDPADLATDTDGLTDAELDAAPDASGPIGPCVPADEICNQRDDDCDTSIDEGAVCCRLNPELCNGRDDDCDNAIDEGAECCEGGEVELCNGADDDCDGAVDEADVCCVAETCNGIDDDCDEAIDEGTACCVAAPELCNGADDDCDEAIDEANACCQPSPELCNGADDDCDGQADEGNACCAAETCNGIDDDCDGRADEGRVCGLFVQDACRVFIAWADSRRGPAGASATWGGCPAQNTYRQNAVHCAGTTYDGDFAVIDVDGNVDETDQFAFSLTCRDTGDAALSTWVQSRCALFMGYADNNRAPTDVQSFAGCPPGLAGRVGDLSCTSTGYDGRFRALNTQGDVDENDDFAFAWQCQDDPARPGLAASMTAQVEVFVGWADEDAGPAHGSPTWGGCPAASRSYVGNLRCVGTRGDGRFNRLDLNGDVNGDDMFGIAIRAR
jgi:hypothetical protein